MWTIHRCNGEQQVGENSLKRHIAHEHAAGLGFGAMGEVEASKCSGSILSLIINNTNLRSAYVIVSYLFKNSGILATLTVLNISSHLLRDSWKTQ